jgi:photosystem II stability/assembly factor-like uncharacterized protein
MNAAPCARLSRNFLTLAALKPATFLFFLILFVAMPFDANAQKIWTVARTADADDFNAVHFADSRRGWIVGDGGIVLGTTDEGATWARQTVETKASISDISFRTKDDGCLVAGASVFCTSDGGARWRETTKFNSANFGGLTPELTSLTFANKRRGIIVGSLVKRDAVLDSLVLLTEDGGGTWRRVVVPTKNEMIDVDFAGDERAWAVGAGGMILRTEDGGRSWTAQSSGTRVVLYNVEFRSNRKGWAVGAGGTILRTANGGETWSAARSNVRSTLLGVRFINDDDGRIVGRGGVVLGTKDGGNTWARQESRTTENLFALYATKDQWWAVGAKGILLRQER